MAQLQDPKTSYEVVKHILGSTEGSFYYDFIRKKFVDERYSATVSTEDSGLSFGLTHLDVANNDNARALFKELLADALFAGRITTSEADDFFKRANTVGLKKESRKINATVKDFTDAEKRKIADSVFGTPSARRKIDKADAVGIRKAAQYTVDLIDAVRKAWGTAGVFDENNPDHLKAVGHVISWVNRTKKPTAMTNFLVGNNQKVNKGKVLRIQNPPTLGDVENYLLNNKQFVLNPREFPNVNDNIDRGIDSLRRIDPKNWKFGEAHGRAVRSALA